MPAQLSCRHQPVIRFVMTAGFSQRQVVRDDVCRLFLNERSVLTSFKTATCKDSISSPLCSLNVPLPDGIRVFCMLSEVFTGPYSSSMPCLRAKTVSVPWIINTWHIHVPCHLSPWGRLTCQPAASDVSDLFCLSWYRLQISCNSSQNSGVLPMTVEKPTANSDSCWNALIRKISPAVEYLIRGPLPSGTMLRTGFHSESIMENSALAGIAPGKKLFRISCQGVTERLLVVKSLPD